MRGPLLLSVNIVALAGMLAGLITRSPPDHPLVEIVALGEVDPELVAQAAETLAAQTALSVEIAPPMELPALALDHATGRYSADHILATLEPHARRDVWKTVFIASQPLSLGTSPFDSPLSGLGAVRGSACILSTWTFEERSGTRASLHRRVAALVLHETGHSLGLHHCSVGGCVMRPSDGDTVAWADLGSNTYCVLCRLKLPPGLLKDVPAQRPGVVSALH